MCKKAIHFLLVLALAIPVFYAPVIADSVTAEEPLPFTAFFASFETSEEVQALSNVVVESQNLTLATATAAGPNATADPVYGATGGRSWHGTRALRVTGTQPAGGNASATNLIFDDLNILVDDNTELSYVILPEYNSTAPGYSVANWDWDFTSQYICVDLAFSDGTRLSTLGGVDQYGHAMSGRGQGEARHLYQKQWNLVKSNIGEVAKGKTIQKIFVHYEKPVNKNARDWNFSAYIDYLRIRQIDRAPKASLVEYANALAGNNDMPLYSRGNQWPAIMTPNAFNVWAPSNQPTNTHMNSNSAQKIYTPRPEAGITQITVTHQASTWIGDFGTFNFMANTNHDPESTTFLTDNNRRTMYDKDTMIANPGYLSIDFSDAGNAPAKGVKLELTPTEHAAAVRFTFPADSIYANVIFDCIRATSGGSIRFDENGKTFTAVTAHNFSNNEGRTANMHIYGVFDVVPVRYRTYTTTNPRSMVTFPEGTTVVNMKLATSFISGAQAKKNLELEIADHATFDDVKAATAKIWNDLLGTVEIEGASEEQKKAFYSNLYRTYADPLLLSENIGTSEEPVWAYASPYGGTSSTTRPTVAGYKMYYNNGFWDTFRGAWATYQLLTPEHAGVMLDGLTQHYIDSDWLARWLAPAGRNSMVGTSSDIIFGDAVAKNLSKFDLENAYMASLKNASAFAPNATSVNATPPSSSYAGRAGMDQAPYLGYTHATNLGLSWAIDNYLNDFGVSLMAEKLGKTDEAIYFRNTAQNFVNLWNYSGGGWFIGKTAAGAWQYPNGLTFHTSGNDSAFRKANPYEETNGFTMTFSGFADMHGLANLYGGKEKLAERLDRLFTDETMFNGIGRDMFVDFYDSKMGNYGHGNQPNFHIPFVYTYAGQPYKTQQITRDILDRIYVGTSFDQLFPGDQDNGSMSGWAVMSALGFYPISNGTDGYIITSPLHDKTTLNLPTGKIEIILHNNSRKNVYIQSMTVDGVPYSEVHISTKDLLSAKKIVFEMGPEPSDWACDSMPPSITPADSDEVPNPLKDFTTSGVEIVDSMPAGNRMTEAAYVQNMAANAETLFNNTNANHAVFDAPSGSICYYFPNAKKVEMITLTSASTLDDSTPDSFWVYGSHNGTDWTLLGERTGIQFDWVRQLKPFAIHNDTAYKYYRLDLKAEADIRLSQVELMGYAIDIISAPKMIGNHQNSFHVVTDHNIANLWLRDSNFNRITDAQVSAANVNANGTKTFTVTFEGDVPDLFYITATKRFTAASADDYEVTSSRKTIRKSSIADIAGSFDIIADVLEWGTAVTAVIIETDKEVTQAEVDSMHVVVNATTVMPRNGNTIYDGPRIVTKAYVSATSDQGSPAASGKYIVLELKYGYNDTAAQVNGSTAVNYVSQNFFLNLNYTVTINGTKLDFNALVRPIYDDFKLVPNPVAGFASESYRMFTPAGREGQKIPLIIFNHGAGETYNATAGGNEGAQLFANMGGVGWVKNAPEDAYVLVPQRGTGAGAPGYSRPGVIAFVNHLIEQGQVDGDRVYVSGASAGGTETHNYLREYPEVFAAAIPICPASTLNTVAQVEVFKYIPTWYVHANTDTSTRPPNSETPYNLLREIGAKDVRRTNFPTAVTAAATRPERSVFGTELPHADYVGTDGLPLAYYPDGHWSWVMLLNNEFVNDGGIGGNHPGSVPTEHATTFMDWLFAQVRPDPLTVTYIVDDEEYRKVEVRMGGKAERPADPQKPGYRFHGWLLEGEIFDFNHAIIKDIILVADLKRIPVTSVRIDSLSIATVARYETRNFGVILNDNAISDKIDWTIADPSLGYVDEDGNVTIFDKTGNVRLTATDRDTGISHSITLRIAS